ncbi:hypothetical protein HJFPF1_11660 [Paramyrothecium foliicola]|nr:hypothetical protein HJFPF1_11660 [Paramyrothecium foliicola]
MAGDWFVSYEKDHNHTFNFLAFWFDGAVITTWVVGLAYVGVLGTIVEKLSRQQRFRIANNFAYGLSTVYTVMYLNNPVLMFFFVTVVTFVVAHLVTLALLKRIIPEIRDFFLEVLYA